MIKNVLKSFWVGFVKFLHFLLPPKSDKENIFQYIIRQLLIPDSHGVPSFTVTMTVFVMVIIGFVVASEFQNSFKIVRIYSVDKKIIQESVKGFSAEFIYFMISLSAVIMYWYRQRSNKVGSDEKGEVAPSSGLIETVKTYVNNIVPGKKE
jgi:hypothetical protein